MSVHTHTHTERERERERMWECYFLSVRWIYQSLFFLSLFVTANNASVYSLVHAIWGSTCRNTFSRNRIPWVTVSLAGDLWFPYFLSVYNHNITQIGQSLPNDSYSNPQSLCILPYMLRGRRTCAPKYYKEIIPGGGGPQCDQWGY